MKYTSILVLFICAFAVANAQINLVLNPSFEQYTHCPDNGDEAKYSAYWWSLDSVWSPPDWAHDPNGVPEYCNVCATDWTVGVPVGELYYHYPRTGNGMMEIQTFCDQHDFGPYDRDYLQGHLSQTLVAGHIYNVTFYTTMEKASVYAINHIGAYFDNGTIDTTTHPYWVQSQYTPQVFDSAIISDTLNWTKIQGTFVATGMERLITIGNYSDLEHIHAIPLYDTNGLGGSYSWYLIDDVSVIDCNNQPNAGDDTLIYPGDSVFLGTNEILIPYTWYVLDSTTPIDSGGGFWAKPTVTTTYVVRQDNICGEGYRYDTVVVRVWPDTVVNSTPVLNLEKLTIYPNPATSSLTIAGAKGCEVNILDIVGQSVLRSHIETTPKNLDISHLYNGIFFVEITDKITGTKKVSKILKE